MQKSGFTLLLIAGVLCAACAQPEAPAPPAKPTVGQIEQLAPELASIVVPDTPIHVLSDGYVWTEGPLWVPALNGVLFADIPANAVYLWTEADSVVQWLQPSGHTSDPSRSGEPGANGMILDQDGHLVFCQHGDRRLARLSAPWSTPSSTFETVADTWDGKRFNSPNDVALHSSGALYFTDPPYGLPQQAEDPSREIPFQGVYRVAPDGMVTMLVDSLSRPNGLAFSPDERTLYVANSDPNAARWLVYDVANDGTLTNGRVFFDATSYVPERPGLPDGLEVDTQGNVIATGPGGVWILTPEAEHLGTIQTTQATSNVAFGEDGRTLFITADRYLLSVRMQSTGLGF